MAGVGGGPNNRPGAASAPGLYDKAVEVLNDLKIAVDKNQKQDLLSQLQEILFNRDPNLLPRFYPFLLDLQSEKTAVVRKFVVNVIDAYFKRSQQSK